MRNLKRAMLDWTASESDADENTTAALLPAFSAAMRRLFLLRHANSERSHPGGRDDARMLSERGRGEAPILGAYMARHNLRPDRVLVSNATRAKETWELVAAALTPRPPAIAEERLYDAGPRAILDVLREQPTGSRSVMVVGHNPGLHEVAMLLIAAGDVEARERLHEGMPTAGLAVIDFAFDDWKKLHPQAGRLERFVSPRSLAPATD
jgi:phosphohistidine phosphatase